MSETKQACKLSIVNTFDYNKLKPILEAIENLGYEIVVVDNGNFLVNEKERDE